ncbi:MAG: carboxypeptidase-like regulatory domain-containing protein [Bacteroidetes bacterium]|nr:carboxypeptidase-like regulatory domain-containing protein [Bacteroidota bacterium]
MKSFFQFSLLLCLLFLFSFSYAQYELHGKVIDHKSGQPLAFVTIIFNKNGRSGTTSDIDGRFRYSQKARINTVKCSYLGYKPYFINLDSIQSGNQDLLIELSPSAYDLNEVTIIAGENPANGIIRKVINNKDINDPEKISSFRYTSYNKSIYDFSPNETKGSDSLKIKLDKSLKGGHLLIMESVTDRKFMSPDINQETVTATRVSGFKHPSFAQLATDLQPFSFYKDNIRIFDINYLNPISNGSLDKYQFFLKDTLYQHSDSVFILSFKPLPGKNFDALTGLLYINTNRFAIQNVIAEPFVKGFIDIKIQQQYNFIDGKQWFPEQLNFEFTILEYPSKKMGMLANGKSYISDVQLYPNFRNKEFTLESVSMHPLATDRDSTFWNSFRTEPLTRKERITYRVMDSIGEKNKLDFFQLLLEKITQNKIPVGFIDLDLSRTLIYNKHEGTRLGMGLWTNEKVLDYLSIGGFFGYGTIDHTWKYGAEFILTLNKYRELKLRGKYWNSLSEAGNSGLNFFAQNSYDYRSLMASRMDRIEMLSASLGFRALRYARINFSFNHTSTQPQFKYEYLASPENTITDYTSSDIRLDLRYAFREKIVESLNQRVSVSTRYPVFFLTYIRGIRQLHNSDFDYNKIEARLEHTFFTKNIGETQFRLDAGLTDKALPCGLLFNGNGSFDNSLPFVINNSFQTVKPYEFLSDRYINLYLTHKFGTLLFQTPKFKPHITLHQNMGYGSLSHPGNHHFIEFKSLEKGIIETGLQLDNLLRINYLNIAYLGLGVGIYYRYGPNSFTETEDNLSLKLSIALTTK